MSKIHVIKDETLGGIEREYIGEYEELSTKGGIHVHKAYGLAPTDIVRIDGTRYRMVKRSAKIGENVLIVNDEGDPEHNGKFGVVVFDFGESASVNIDDNLDYYPHVYTEEYRILEPVADEYLVGVDQSQASPEVLDLLANLARRVTSLEAQLKDTQGNVEKLAEELAELKHLSQSNSDDIALLDDRTNVINAIQKFYGGVRR